MDRERKARRKAEKKVVSSKETNKLKIAVDEVLRTPHGRALWAHLFNQCGYNVTSLVRKVDGEMAPMATECKEAQRLVYINLRSLASPTLLAKAEELAEKQTKIQPQAETERERKPK